MSRPVDGSRRRLLAAVAVTTLLLGACSDGEDDGSGPATPSFCDSVSGVNDALDFISAAFLSVDQDTAAADLREVLADGLATMDAAVGAAPSARLDAATTIRDAYAGLDDALADVDHVVARLEADDERLAAIADPALSAAIASVNEECS